ncbi:MAG TPA: CsgG/HfaB family protein [Candidatus Saccharimonadales bacterium]|jgi:curli biogenesis system outer membrane secretion channel CsgG|nr:CsgG/HfaB family protein [Candidatus Saccharimonadales bacterium]
MKSHSNATVVLLWLCLAVLCSSGLQSQESQAATPVNTAPWQGPKLRLAVTDLNSSALKNPPPPGQPGTAYISPPAEFARGITEMLTTALVKSGHFIVLERASLDKVTAEQDFAAGNRANAETSAKAGQIIGAQAIITGDITEFSYSSSGYGASLAGLHGLGSKLGKLKTTARVVIDLRIVDATTGQVVAAQRAEGKATMSNVSAGLFKGQQDFNAATAHDTPLGEATRQALERTVTAIAASMQAVPWSARVIDSRDGMIYINAGRAAGIQAGVEFDVFHPSEPLVDPETGRNLGAPDSLIGSVAVEKALDNYAVARITSGSGMQRGDVVRIRAGTGH